MCKEYQGWNNKETWLIHLWLTENQESYIRWLKFKNADEIKEHVEKIAFSYSGNYTGLCTDLLNHAIASADYQELWQACKDAQEDLIRNS